MIIEKYNPNTLSVSAILGLIKSRDIAIPEIQRPFAWKKTQVRDLLDSLYKGYPTGYLIIRKNPNVRLKDGSVFSGIEFIKLPRKVCGSCFCVSVIYRCRALFLISKPLFVICSVF